MPKYTDVRKKVDHRFYRIKIGNTRPERAGYASSMSIPPNVKYQKLFVEAVREAREKGVGLWRRGK